MRDDNPAQRRRCKAAPSAWGSPAMRCNAAGAARTPRIPDLLGVVERDGPLCGRWGRAATRVDQSPRRPLDGYLRQAASEGVQPLRSTSNEPAGPDQCTTSRAAAARHKIRSSWRRGIPRRDYVGGALCVRRGLYVSRVEPVVASPPEPAPVRGLYGEATPHSGDDATSPQLPGEARHCDRTSY